MRKSGILFLLFLFLSCGDNRIFYQASSDAMSPAVNTGDHVVVNTFSDSYSCGDIVAYKYEGADSLFMDTGIYLHRIVGLPGDSIAIEDNVCIINGKKNQLCFIGKKDMGYEHMPVFDMYEEIFPNGEKIKILVYPSDPYGYKEAIYIPDGYYYVLGDARSNSADSRVIGLVSENMIIGRVVKITKAD